jgi:alanyl-tRNA synthetase
MQFNRVSIPYPDDVTAVGPRFAVVPLPKPSIDTGMGLERVAAVLQHVISNYETDLFKPLIRQARALINENRQFQDSEQNQASLRIIADHARATTFLISDGVVPSNEGRGYVLRKIMRRAIRHARLLGGNAYVLTNMTRNVADQMSQEYKEPKENIDFIQRVVRAEEERYVRVVEVGFRRLFEQLRPMIKEKQQVEEGKHEIVRYFSELRHNHREPGQALSADVSRLSPIVNKHFVPHTWLLQQAKAWSVSIPDNLENYPEKEWRLDGDKAFRSYDTDGLSRDFIAEVSHDASIPVDWAGFEEEMHLQRMRARASWKGGAGKEANPAFAKIAETHKTEKDFYSHGTESTKDKDARIVAIVLTGSAGRADTKAGPVSELKASESGEVVLDRTVIYAESGGQVADTGAFYDASESQVLAEVTGAYYPVAGLVAHRVKAKETLRVGDRVTVVADAERRARIIRNHSGTHLVHAALRNTLGTHVKQAGSLNAPERLRFDFSHFAPVDAEELRDIEQQVNDEIRWNTPVETKVTTIDDALASGALAFFGDKYPESNVRVVTIPDERAPRGFYSKELCGGVHVHRIGDVGVLKIVGEQSVAAGVRRIEAVTGIAALEHFQQQAAVLSQVASQLNVAEDSVLATVEKMSATVKALEKELEGQKRKGALGQLDDLVGRMQVVKGVKVVAAEVGSVDREGLRQLVDSLRQKLGSGVVALGMPDEDKVALSVGVTKDLTAKVHAGKLIKALAEQVGGSGGGRPDLAEAGGKDTSALKSALGSVPGLLEALL